MQSTTKTSKSRYDAWTPDLQVKALKRLAQSILILTLGFAMQGAVAWFGSHIAVIAIGYLGLLVAIVVAPLVAVTSGVLGQSDPYKLPQFSDEFCQLVIARAYRGVCWVLVLVSLVLLLIPDALIPQWFTETLSLSRLGGLYVLLASFTWAVVVLRLVEDDSADEPND